MTRIRFHIGAHKTATTHLQMTLRRGELPACRWTDLDDDLQSVLPGIPIHVWRYEDYRQHAEAIIRYYADDAIERFAPPTASRPKSGFPARGVAELQRFASKKVGKRHLHEIRERLPVSDADPRFDPWSEAQKKGSGRAVRRGPGRARGSC